MPDENYTLSKIALLYYVEDLNQREIAERMNMSIAAVSRAITRARERGFVEIRIHSPEQTYPSLEREIEKQYGLRDCIVLPALGDMQTTYRSMARAVETLFLRHLPPGGLLGVSWGETLKAVGDETHDVHRLGADTIPILGGMGTIETGIYPNTIARTFGERLGGNSFLVNTPAIVDDRATRNALLSDSNFQSVAEKWRHLDLVILSVSATDPEASAFRHGVLSETDREALDRDGVRCMTNFVLLDGAGHVVRNEVSERLIHCPLETLLEVPVRLVVAGGLAKAQALQIALRAGVPNLLVVDEDLAAALVDQRAVP
ncbi:MAG: MarR family transcriptional regulator [Spirochaetes bacterium]|nr:MarR family transcriptional regulator [Spirochaetota bacterium]